MIERHFWAVDPGASDEDCCDADCCPDGGCC